MNPLLFLRELATDAVIERLGWVLVHSLWQFALVALVAAVVVRWLVPGRAAARYAVLVGALATIVACPALTWSLQPVPVVQTPTPVAISHPTLDEAAGNTSSAASDVPVATIATTESGPPVAETVPAALSDSALPAPTPAPLTWWAWAETELRPWLAWIVVAWSCGVVLCSLRPLVGWHALWRLRRVGVSPVGEEIAAALRRVARQLGLRRAVQVLQSTLIQTPVLIGYFRPAILLPVGLVTGLPIAQLEAILAHELAHVCRHDFVVNLLQTLVETLCFYHPAVWWLSRQIRVEREHCCDDLVVRLLGNRVEYGRALLAVEELRATNSVLALGMADGVLLSRVRRLVGGNGAGAIDRRPAALLTLATFGLLLVLGLVWHRAAQDDDDVSQAAIARLPGEITVELVGVSFHPSADKAWWKPDGSVIERPRGYRGLGKFISPQPGVDRNREFLVEVRGLKTDQFFVSECGASGGGPFYEFEGLRRHEIAGGTFPTSTTTVKVRVAADPFGPTLRIDKDGTSTSRPEIPNELKSLYSRFVPKGVIAGVAGDTELVFQIDAAANQTSNDVFQLEIVAVAVGGAKAKSWTDIERSGEFRRPFGLSLKEIDHFEYHLRPYRHVVTFENVSLEPGRKTEVKVSTESLPEPVVAKLPGDIAVELVGVGPHPSKDKSWWRPDGRPLEPRPTLEGGFSVMSGSPEQAQCREFLIHIRGLPREHAVATDYGPVSAATGSLYSNGLWVGEHGAGPFESGTTSVRVGLTTEAYGPTVEIDITGTRQPVELTADLRPFYDRVVPLRVEEVDGQTELILDGKASNNLFKEAEWELHAVDVDGEKHRRSSESVPQSGERHFTFKLPRNRIARFEYRLRPYRHWVTFHGVSLEPGRKSDVKVSVETVAVAQGFPPPAPDQVRGLKLEGVPVRTYSAATRLSPEQQEPELLTPDPAPSKPFRRPKNVFQMPLAENIWLKYPAGTGHFYINDRPDGTWEHERLYGPIPGDPFEVLQLEAFLREQLQPGRTGGDARYRLTLMFRTGDPGLIRRAWNLAEPELAVADVEGRLTERDPLRFERLDTLERVRDALQAEAEAFRRPELTDVVNRMRAAVAAVEAAVDALNDAVPAETYESVTDLQSGIQGKIPDALWGPPLDGLRLGLVPRESINWAEWQKLPAAEEFPATITARAGDELLYQLLVENVSDHEIRLCGYVVGEEMGRGLDVLDRSGRPVFVNGLHTSIPHFLSYWRLKPGERRLLPLPAVHLAKLSSESERSGLGYFVEAAPGEYTLRCRFRFGHLDNERHRYVPGKSEWIGELSTGTQRVVVADSRAGNESGAVGIQYANADQAHAVAPNGEIRGRLIDLATDRPVAGATVACGAIINDSGNGGGSNAVTDAEGRYRLPVPSPGIYNVWLKNYPLDLAKTATADDGILVEAGKVATSQMWLAAGRKVSGKVVDSAGSIGANLTVYCHSAARPHSGGVQSTKTNLEGAFELFLPPGRAYVYTETPGEKAADNPLGTGRTASAHVMVAARTDPAPLTLTLQRPDPKFGDPEWLRRSTPWTQIVRREGNQDVTGTVVSETGMPVPEAKVFPSDGPTVTTGATGEFRVKTLKGTQLVMFAFLPGYHVWFGTPTSGDVLKIVLEKKGMPREAVAAELPQDPLQRRVDLSVNQTPLREAIETVAAQAGLKVEFAVPVAQFDWHQKVTAEFENIRLFAALNLLFGPPVDNGIIRKISGDKLVLAAFRDDQVASLNETERALQTLAKRIDEFSAAPNDWQQLEAARRIIALGGKWAIPRLLPFLTSADRRARCNAGFVLACLEDERGLATLIRELQDTAPRPTELKRSDGTADAARQITSDRYYAAHLLGQLGDKAAVPALIDATRDRTIDYAAAIALGEIGDRQAIPALRQMLKDAPRQRLWAAYGLAAVGEAEGFEILAEFLADPVWEQRRHAVEALGKIGDRRSVPVVVKVLKDEHANVRVSAARALGQIGDPAAIPALTDALGDTEATKVNAPTTVASEATKAIATIRERQNGGQGDKFQEDQRQVPDGNQPIRATLTGRFVYDGEAPPRKDVWPHFAQIDPTQRQQPGPDGRFSGVEATYREFLKQNIRPSTLDPSLLVDSAGGVANVVIWVTSKEIPWTPPADLAQRPVTIRLRDGNFAPRMTVATVGQPVLVENHDPVPFHFHAEFLRALNSPVNVLLPARSIEAPQRLTLQAAEPFPARFQSDIGPWANGWLMMHGNPFVAVSQADGSFALPDLPPGEWEFRVWHERSGYVRHWPQGRFKRVIQPGENDLGTIRLKPEVFGVPAAVAESPPSNREQIGEVGGKPVFRDEITDETLHSVFLGAALERYREAHRAEIAPTEAEIRSAGEYFDRKHRERLAAAGGEAKLREQLRTIETQLATSGLPDEDQQKLELEHLRLRSPLRLPSEDRFAEFMLRNWKLQKHLYDNYGGGRILWQQAGLEAIDAMRRWMEAQEQAGVFKITDTALRARFYEYWTRDHGPFLTADKERIRKEFLEPEWLAPTPAKASPSAD